MTNSGIICKNCGKEILFYGEIYLEDFIQYNRFQAYIDEIKILITTFKENVDFVKVLKKTYNNAIENITNFKKEIKEKFNIDDDFYFYKIDEKYFISKCSEVFEIND
jgi:hypothetical protein